MSEETKRAAEQVFRSLRTKAKAQYGGNTQGLLVVYGTESFLRRLAMSPYADRLVLKGGMLMAASSIRQMTKDGDFSARGVGNDMNVVIGTVAQILRLTPDPLDGFVFDAESVRAEIVRQDDKYHGVRCRTKGALGEAVVPLSLDFSFGDAGEWEPITIESVIDMPGVNVRAYPLALNLAEKAVTAMQRGAANTRDRDFADLWVASRRHVVRAGSLRRHIVSVAERRGQPLITMSQALARMPNRQNSYAAMVERMSYLAAPPGRWDDLLRDVIDFLDPLIEDREERLRCWSPDRGCWLTAG